MPYSIFVKALKNSTPTIPIQKHCVKRVTGQYKNQQRQSLLTALTICRFALGIFTLAYLLSLYYQVAIGVIAPFLRTQSSHLLNRNKQRVCTIKLKQLPPAQEESCFRLFLISVIFQRIRGAALVIKPIYTYVIYIYPNKLQQHLPTPHSLRAERYLVLI